MITPKNARYLLMMAVLPLMLYKARAQKIDEKTYLHKMQLIDSLSFYKMSDYDTLRYFLVSKSYGNNEYKEDYYGWVNKQDEKHLFFLNINGKELEIEKRELTQMKPMPLNQETIDSLISRGRRHVVEDWGNFASTYELVLWLYKKGHVGLSKQLLPERPVFFADTNLRDGFGALYYDAMLSAYSNQRNYEKAIAFGEHLSGGVFKGYEYQKESIALTRQLKNNPADFKTFRIPDSLEWRALKQKLTRNEQIVYLADRLRLLNCIQPGQPAGVSYDMYQYSMPYIDAGKSGVSYWDHNATYAVINPFVELLLMKLNLKETELLLPYLLTDTYIPTYNYHRDFFPERNLHKLSWVAETLVFKITDKLFFYRLDFDALTLEQQKAEVAKIKKWCDENAALSPETLTVKQLKTADNWNSFLAAMRTARQQKNDSLLSIIIQRFNDFNDSAWPSHRAALAQAMYELGGEKYIGTVKNWNKDTTDKSVSLWTSMFLIKYDRGSYELAMQKLEAVLKQCDGTTYYPHAMDLLLSMKDKRAFKLAEGIVDKSEFQSFIEWDYYVNITRKLLLAKSDHTFSFLSAKLDAYTADKMKNDHKDNDHVMAELDSYVLTVDLLRSDKKDYFSVTSNKERLAYIGVLNKWFKSQYVLLKEGKPNELRLEVVPTDAPVSFVDTYYR